MRFGVCWGRFSAFRDLSLGVGEFGGGGFLVGFIIQRLGFRV